MLKLGTTSIPTSRSAGLSNLDLALEMRTSTLLEWTAKLNVQVCINRYNHAVPSLNINNFNPSHLQQQSDEKCQIQLYKEKLKTNSILGHY